MKYHQTHTYILLYKNSFTVLQCLKCADIQQYNDVKHFYNSFTKFYK